MSRAAITVVGEYEAQELLETPNFALGGLTPLELLDRGEFEPVAQLVKALELDEFARSKWIKTQPLVIEYL